MKNITLAIATVLAGLLLALALPGVAMAACQLLIGDGFTVEVCTTDPATPTPTPPPTGTPQPTPAIPPPSAGGPGIWISPSELAQLPTTGAAWADMQSAANRPACTPDLSNQDDSCNVTVLAKALAYARTRDARYADQVVVAIRTVTTGNTESGGRTLALGRELVAYIVAADLIELESLDPALNNAFKIKLRELLTKNLDGRTLQSTHEDRPNNWGTMAGASRAGIAAYLGDKDELDRTAQVFQGYLGDRSAYAKFAYGSLDWQCNAAQPVGINPAGCTKSGQSIGGAQPEEMRRAGGFKWPPSETGYAWEGLQGTIVQAELLHRAGYPAWEWSDRAICRAVQFLSDIKWPPSGDDRWQIALITARCGAIFTGDNLGSGKIMGWAAWTHGGLTVARSADPLAAPDVAGDLEQRIIVDSDLVALTEEVDYLISLGWRAVGELQTATDDEGEPVYSQAMVR